MDDYVRSAHLVSRFVYGWFLFSAMSDGTAVFIGYMRAQEMPALVFPGLMRWLGVFDPWWLLVFMYVTFLFGSLWAALRLESFVARAAAATGHLLFYCFIYARTSMGHESHGWMVVAFLLLLLPNAPLAEIAADRALKVRFAYAFGAAQFYVFFLFFMNGLWKVFQGILDADLLRSDTLPVMVANYLNAWNKEGPWSRFIVTHAWTAHALYLGSVYLHFYSYLAFFRPQSHQLWGVGLVLFTVASYFIFDIEFARMALLACIMMIFSPACERYGLRQQVRGLPLAPTALKLISLITGPRIGSKAWRRH